MYVEWIELENVMCFEKARLDFLVNGELMKWNLLLGENGTGKSTILKLVTLLLMEKSYHYHLMPDPKRIIRDGAKYASVKLGVRIKQKKWVSCKIEYRVSKRGKRIGLTSSRMPMFYREPSNVFVAGYGATRLMTRDEPLPFSRRDETRVETIFLEGRTLEPIEKWLSDLEYRSFKAPTGPQNTRFEIATRLMSDILPGVEFKEIDMNSEVVFSTPYGDTRFAEMSRGYQDVLTWVGDLLRKLFEFTKRDIHNIFKIPGVVLVEEIALHLHPTWQRKVISYVRNRFPEIQFIATTHSPLAAQSVGQGELVILEQQSKKKGRRNTVEVKRLDIVPNALTVDQILTSSYFGLDSASSIETSEKMEQFYELKRKIAQGKASPEEEKEYTKLRDYLDGIGEAPGMSDRERQLFRLMQDMLSEMGRGDMVERPTLDELKKKLTELGGESN